MYEDLKLIPPVGRKENGYRVFTDVHIDQFKIARTAFQIEVLQAGLRKKIVQVVKLSANGQYEEAMELTKVYIQIIDREIANAKEAVEIVNELITGIEQSSNLSMKRKEVSELLGLTIDTIRNWEMSGLIKVKRKENGYRTYGYEEIQKLKIIRSLRCANYSLSAILRMMNAYEDNKNVDTMEILNTPEETEDIILACDQLIVSLESAKENAIYILKLLSDMKNKYENPPL